MTNQVKKMIKMKNLKGIIIKYLTYFNINPIICLILSSSDEIERDFQKFLQTKTKPKKKEVKQADDFEVILFLV
jgi:hypothetical protein